MDVNVFQEDGVDGECLPPFSHTAAPPAPKPVTTQPHMMPTQPVSGKQQGVLTANLSELDMLLEDLSSAQFMEVLDSRGGAQGGFRIVHCKLH